MGVVGVRVCESLNSNPRNSYEKNVVVGVCRWAQFAEHDFSLSIHTNNPSPGQNEKVDFI